jgi:hypothetical protein
MREPKPLPPSGRGFRRQPALWRFMRKNTAGKDDPVAEAQLSNLRTFRDTQFLPSLVEDIENIFQEVRASQLILAEGVEAA